jgi:RNA polymerase subunit RPABC4/transcription elongation factor Spt4
MIDRLPLDLFGDGEPESAPSEGTEAAPAEAASTPVAEPTASPAGPTAATVNCPWCAASVPADARICPACEARIPGPEPATPQRHDGICQWCGATIAAEIDTCPDCGWDARGSSEIEMPGLTTPLSEEQIRSLYGDDPEPDPGDIIALAADIITLIVPRD